MTLAEQLEKMTPPPTESTEPVWQGPSGTGHNGGVSQSMLGRYLGCKERFRIGTVLGLRPADKFEPRRDFGSMWHVCEEALAKGTKPSNKVDQWQPLKDYCRDLCRKYPMQQDQVNHWYEFCKVQFPLYVKHWQDHPDVKDRTPLMQEQVFDVSYKLPSGRTVRLRGKWDALDLIEG